jgi:hypothetical protein
MNQFVICGAGRRHKVGEVAGEIESDSCRFSPKSVIDKN